jgi:hypothetical protein
MTRKWHDVQSDSQSVIQSVSQSQTAGHGDALSSQTFLYWLQPCIKSTLSADLQCVSPAASEHVTVNSSDVQRSGRFMQHCVLSTVQYGDNSHVSGFMNRLAGKHTNMGPGFNEQYYWDTTRESGFMNNVTETDQFPFLVYGHCSRAKPISSRVLWIMLYEQVSLGSCSVDKAVQTKRDLFMSQTTLKTSSTSWLFIANKCT